MHGYLEVDVVKKKLEPWLQGKITLLTAQWVDMGALENRNHASLSCFFSTLGAVRQISSGESVSSKVVMRRHALSA